ncbi:hypothetical protein [Lutimonas zeaxanthinifaciens]|uniref:hypothetical protein n=1 Tax=Lutimonas zeaxanthinifaciens TaxID=3060215 RepID=UPI00265D00A6|nr:hypothetical protein [Lutimonas sp. YSD2104]WKK65587.1 hypothetical protein QZH61_13480 [Lutimonas sp. YSD2104]
MAAKNKMLSCIMITNKFIVFGIVLLLPSVLWSQFSSNISRNEKKRSFVSFSASYGEFIERDAWFYGFNGEFSKRLKNVPIGIAGSLMWDQEKDVKKDKIVSTFTAAVTGSYLISNRWSVGTGLGKGFMDTDNSNKKYKWADGDWSTALFFGYQIPLNLKSSIGISASYEYNMSANETSLSLDVSYGFSL